VLLGAPCCVTTFVPDVVVRDEPAVQRALAGPIRRRIAYSLVDTLAELHAVDAAAVGLQDLGRGAGYVQRQLRRWQEQARAQRSAARPLADRVYEHLLTCVPRSDDVTIVHGDYRLDNVIVEPEDGAIRAVLDWELCNLGDPLADLGVFLSYWTEARDSIRPFPSAPTVAAGFPTRDQLIARYARRSGRDVGDVAYYLAFAHWRLALVLEGVHARFTAGAYGDAEPRGHDDLPNVVAQLVERAAGLSGVAPR
jgi:aminoglycoside phosphotransferase (APT) family kinase protein